MPMLIDIKELLKQAEAAGLSDADICKATRKHHITLYRWRKGSTRPHLGTMLLLMKAIDTKRTADDIAEWARKEFTP